MGRLLRIIVVVVAALSLGGCFSSEPKFTEVVQVSAEQRAALTATEGAEGGDGGGEAGITWVGFDIGYEETTKQAAAGSLPVRFENTGAIVHNVVIEEMDDLKILEAAGGETDSGTVEFPSGTYVYYCDIPGHRAAGMEGTLTVTG